MMGLFCLEGNMSYAYLNSPNAQVTIHDNSSCNLIMMMHKEHQRVIKINPATISIELEKFSIGEYLFAANAEKNDMWLIVNFTNLEFEHAVIQYIHHLLSMHYRRFANANTTIHCHSE